MSAFKVAALIAFLFLNIFPSVALAQASLAAENIIDSVVFEYTDATGTRQKADVTVVRDAREVNQWYYVPSSPILVTNNVNGINVPVFSLLRYDYADPNNGQTINTAGLLNFAVRLSLPPEATEGLKAALIQEVRKRNGQISADAVRVAALPVISATTSIFNSDNRLVGTAEGTGIAPTFASQHMAFSMPLTDVGVPVFEALVKTPAGIRTAVQYNYYGLTPPAGFKVKLNYRNAFDHYSKNEQFRARASYYGFFSASAASDRTTIREGLVNSGAMTIEIIDSQNFTIEKIDAYLQPILKRINDQILETQKPPVAIDPAQAPPPSGGGYFGSAAYSVAMKEVSKVKTQVEEIDFRQQSIVERSTVASGFIGIANYSEAIKQQLFTAVDGVVQKSAYIAFPEVPRGIKRVDLVVELKARDEVFSQRTYQYLVESGWKDIATGKPADRIGFSLAGVEQRFGKAALREASFAITKVLRSQEDNISTSTSSSSANAAQAIDLQDKLAGLRLRPTQVMFRQMGGDVQRVVVRASHGTKTKDYVFEAVNANSTWQSPTDEFFFIPSDAIGQKARVRVQVVRQDTSKNTVVEKEIEVSRGLTYVLLDEF